MAAIIGILSIISMEAHAQKYDSQTLAENLGPLLASEQFCGLSYDQGAISKYVSENVDAADLEFTQKLGLYTRLAAPNLAEMSASQKTAHCTQLMRVAKSFGFIVN
jgi:hypothetical protein